MKEIQLSQGLVAFVDDDDYDILSVFKWYAQKSRNTFYAQRFSKISQNVVMMHRAILNPSEDFQVDHRDGNGLNNLKSNLRIATHAENKRNACIQKNNRVGLKGVSFCKRENKYRAVIHVDKRYVSLGYFLTPEEAYAAYCAAAILHHGEFARLQ